MRKSSIVVQVCTILLFGLAFGQAELVLAQAEISPALAQRLAAARADEAIAVYALLNDQADVKSIRAAALARGSLRQARNTMVLKSLRSQNESSQAAFVTRLQSVPDVTNVRGRWIVNLVGFSATPERILALAADPAISALHLDAPWVFEQASVVATTTVRPGGTEPGHRAINANKVWARGYTGFGGVGFTADTGVDPFHPALNHKYAGHDGRPASFYNYDGPSRPFDCALHGTHVTGTIMGLDRVTHDTIGVAPDAHWIGGAILCSYGTVDNIGAFEWALNPDADAATEGDRPFVINNSWYDPSIDDVECSASNPYPTLLDNLFAAGIAVIWSAGNSGPDPSTITAPHNYNGNLVNAFSIGALDGNKLGYAIAEFSSRGPARCLTGDAALDIKPEVSAPGVDVRSSIPGGYGQLSGTSMASPHVAGSVLLLHEAFPELDGEAIMLALYYSAVDLGDPGEDNTYGRGIIDVDLAYNYLVAAGNEPVPAARPARGANVIAVEASSNQCGSLVEATLTIENQGTVALDSLTYRFELPGETYTRTVAVNLEAGESGRLSLSETTQTLGQTFAAVRITHFNGEPADPRLDLGASFLVYLSAATLPTVSTAQTDSSLCLGSPVLLDLLTDIDDRRVTYFTTDPNFSFVPGELDRRFLVASVDSAITLYGVNEYRRSGGPTSPDTELSLNYATGTTADLSIRVLQDCIIRGFTVFAQAGGRLYLEIRDDSDELVGRAIPLLKAGENRVVLQAELTKGETYKITATRSPSLGYLPGTGVSRSTVPGLVDLVRISTTNAEVRDGSYFLFDWEVGYRDGCAPVVISLSPDSSRIADLRELAILTETPQVAKPLILSDATLPSGSQYRWYVAEEPLPDNTATVSITPTQPGTLEVLFTTLDEVGCAELGTGSVTITEASVSVNEEPVAATRRLSPNPARDHFVLSPGEGDVARVDLVDPLGRIVRTYASNDTNYSVVDLEAAIYRVLVTRGDGKVEVYALEVLR